MVQILRASNLVGTFGVNTHIPYTDGKYSDIPLVISELKYLGISQVRDSITNGQNGSAPLSSYVQIAEAGIHFTTGVGGSDTSALTASIGLVKQLQTQVPGSVVAVEGANEINNWPVTFNGVGGLQGALNMQQLIYSSVHSDAVLSGVGVDYFTGYPADGGPNPLTTPGLADFDNQHPYPLQGQAPGYAMNPKNVLPNEPGSTGPVVYTETGYSTVNNAFFGSVSEDVQAKYTLDLLLDAAADGVSHTYLYQLMDAYAQGSPQGDDGFGLYNTDGSPKLAATAIHDLTTILNDSSANAWSFTPGDLNYSVTGLPTSGRTLEVEKADGTFDILVWNEPEIWNAATSSEVNAPRASVSLQLGSKYDVSVFDPMLGTSAVQTLSSTQGVTLNVTDHPLIVQVSSAQTTQVSVASKSSHANDLAYAKTASGPTRFIDLLNLEASFPDLIKAFGTQMQSMQGWYNANQAAEKRANTFDGLDYVASYSNLIAQYASAGSMKAVQDAGATDYITSGFAQNSSITFNGLDYIASYGDLIKAFGADSDAGAYQFIEYGSKENRTTSFDGLDYIASYSDLIKAIGANEQAGAAHFIDYGSREGRATSFDGLSYIAQYTDLMTALGANNDAGASHYITNGANEGRGTSFDVAAYEQAHPDLQGAYATPDQFLTAYINTYVTTGHFLT